MEKFYFEKPSITRKEEAIEYLSEHVKCNSEINGHGGLKKMLSDSSYTYEKWLENLVLIQDKEYAESINWVPSSTFFTIRKSDNKIVGMVNIRHYLNDHLKKISGHIGYGIRPTERRKGYAKIQLYMALLEAQKLGLDKVMIDCIVSNVASEKTIQALGGVFDEQVYDEVNDYTLNNYWLNVDECINKYKDIYEQYIYRGDE